MTAFTVHENEFNGAFLTLTESAVTSENIAQQLQQLAQQNKALVWIKLPITRSDLVPMFTAHSFVFHLCDEQNITMICRLQTDAYAPFAPTHTLGVGGLVQNTDGKVLLVRDKWMNGRGLKLPGGYVDLGEDIKHAVEREVLEETGITAAFKHVQGLVTKHPHAMGKSNLYLVCELEPSTVNIKIQDCDEIELAVWVEPKTFIADETCSRFHRHLVESLLSKKGITQNGFKFDDPSSVKNMYLSEC